jgi:hypothetical protein
MLLRKTLADLPKQSHPHLAVMKIQQQYKLPGLFYLDNSLLFPPMLVVSDPAVAMKLTVYDNLPRHPIVQDVMAELVGKHSVFHASGEEWKALRSTM